MVGVAGVLIWCPDCARPCRGCDADGYCLDADREELARREKWLREGVYASPAVSPAQPGSAGVVQAMVLDTLLETDEPDPFQDELADPPAGVDRPNPVAACEPPVGRDGSLLPGGGGKLPAGKEDQAPTVECFWHHDRYVVNIRQLGPGSVAETLREVGRQIRRLANGYRVSILVQRASDAQGEGFVVWDGELWRDVEASYRRSVDNGWLVPGGQWQREKVKA